MEWPYWYSHQTMCVRWAGALSSKFSVTNGVRQGGILSPYLFNVYMDDLSGALNQCQSGCISGNSVINHLMYADDLVVFCPSAAGMSKLLKACEVYGLDCDIKYNSKKSAVIICRNSYSYTRNVTFSSFNIGWDTIEEVPFVKYLGHFICNDMRDDRYMLREIYLYVNSACALMLWRLPYSVRTARHCTPRNYGGTTVKPQLRKCTLHTIMHLECYLGCPVTVVLVVCLLRMVSSAAQLW